MANQNKSKEELIIELEKLSVEHEALKKSYQRFQPDGANRSGFDIELLKFRAIADQAAFGTAIVEMDGTIVYLNSAMAMMHGFDQTEFIGKNMISFHNEEQLSHVRVLLGKLMTDGRFNAEEVWHTKKDGSVFPTLMSASVVHNELGVPKFLSATAIDITSLKATEDALRQSEQALNLAQEIAKMGSWDLDITTNKINWSDNYYRIIEREPENTRPDNDYFIQILHPDDRYLLQVMHDEILSKKSAMMLDMRLVMPDGRIKWVQNNLVPIFQNEKLVSLKGVNIDITEKKQAEQAIKELNTNLEQRISERTSELADANQQLLLEIESRKVFEKALADEKRRLGDIIRGTNIGTWEWNIQTGATVFSERWAEIIGYTLEEISPVSIDTWINFCHPDDLKISGELLENHFRGELDYYHFESRMKHKNGEWIWVFDRGRVHEWDTNGKPLMMSGTHQEITDRKKSEELLENTRRNYQTFFDTADDFLFVLDIQGKIIFNNETVTRRLGYSQEELTGSSVLNLNSLERQGEAQQIIREILEGSATSCLIPLKTKAGEYIPVETRVKIGYWDGKPAMFRISKDISELKLSEEKFSRAFQTNAALMVISGFDDGSFVDVNNAFLKTMEYTRSEVIGKTSRDLGIFLEDDIRNRLLENLKHGRSVRDVEVEMFTKSGKKVIGLISADSIYVADKHCLLETLVDITQRKTHEEELTKAKTEAEKANMAKSEFLSRMSHEFRTPMNSILGFAQLLDMSDLNERQRKGVSHILRSGKHLLDLINEVLDISRIESGRMSLSLEPVELKSIIQEMLEMFHPISVDREVKIFFPEAIHEQLYVRADRQRLKQVLLNLIDNGLKYNKRGGTIMIKTKELPPNESGVSQARIIISDSGVGISPEDMLKIFNPFERIGADKTAVEGTGLGLSVVKKLIEAMGGRIELESVKGQGSTFQVELQKVNQQEFKEIGEIVPKQSEVALSLKTGIILYVEDNPANVELVEQILFNHRHEIGLFSISEGRQTVTMAAKLRPNLILLDLNLPDIHGIEVVKQLKTKVQTSGIPIVIISADALPNQISRLMNAGAELYLSKPLDIHDFLHIVDKFIAKPVTT